MLVFLCMHEKRYTQDKIKLGMNLHSKVWGASLYPGIQAYQSWDICMHSPQHIYLQHYSLGNTSDIFIEEDIKPRQITAKDIRC